MKQDWDISAIKAPKYLPEKKLWEVYGILPKRGRNGKRERLRRKFNTKEEAITFRKDQQDEWRVYHLNTNVRPTHLSMLQESDAMNAFNLLKSKFPTDFETRKLVDAVKYYCDHFDPNFGSITLDQAIERYLKNPKLKRTSKDHQDKTKQKLRNFSDAFDVRNVSEYSVDEIEDYIYDENKEWVDKTRSNHYAIIHAFFQFCEKKDWLVKNPVSKVDKPNPAMLEPEALSIPEVKKLLKVAGEVDNGSMLPYFVLAIFSAVRPSEILRLDWKKFVWDDKKPCFVIEGKGQRRRSVDMHPTCIKWLKPLSAKEGSVAPANAKKLFNLIRAIAGYKVSRKSLEISESEEWVNKIKNCDSVSRPLWIRDVMRHTGITYYLKINNDKNKTAMWAGNSPAIIDSNYRAVDGVTAGTCKQFWDVVPSY